MFNFYLSYKLCTYERVSFLSVPYAVTRVAQWRWQFIKMIAAS